MTLKLSHRNQGSVALAKVGKTQADLAARIGVSRSVVVYWLSGDRVPRPRARSALYKAFKIPIDAWDQPVRAKASAASPAAIPDPPVLEPSSLSARSLAMQLAGDVHQLRSEIRNAADTTPLERAKVYATAAQTIKLLGTVTGETLEISEARILRLPAWTRIQEALIRALSKWPEALRAAGEEIQRMGGET